MNNIYNRSIPHILIGCANKIINSNIDIERSYGDYKINALYHDLIKKEFYDLCSKFSDLNTICWLEDRINNNEIIKYGDTK